MWQRKSDDEVITALMHLDEYNPVGHLFINREAVRRGIEIIPAASGTSAGHRTLETREAVEDQQPDQKPAPGTVLVLGSGLLGDRFRTRTTFLDD